MNDMTMGWIIATVPTLAAVLAPTLTTLINSVKEIKEKRLEQEYKTKLSVFKEFTDSFGAMHYYSGTDAELHRFRSAAHSVSLIASREARDCIKKLLEMAVAPYDDRDKVKDDIVHQFNVCVDLLNHDLCNACYHKKSRKEK